MTLYSHNSCQSYIWQRLKYSKLVIQLIDFKYIDKLLDVNSYNKQSV